MGLLSKTVLFTICGLILCSPSCIAQDGEQDEYERSSIHVMMIKHPNQKFDELVEQCFLKSPFPERFNNHNLGVKVISFAEADGEQRRNIEIFMSQVNLGQKMVSKWFNRDRKTGTFNMELVRERGFYNASKTDVDKARASLRGYALLEDAGENLIGNTYLIVNDIKYISKGSGNWFLKAFGSAYLGNADAINNALTSIGGFQALITSYLFRLKWNDDIANEFYTKYYTEDGLVDKKKVEAYNSETNLFKMEFVGKTESKTVEANFKASKDPSQLLVKTLTRALDKNIALLQHSYADFRIKAPLIAKDEKITAYVGLKEDINKDSKFEVLEKQQDEKGKISYVRVGIIRPIPENIWDNRYMAAEEDEQSSKLKYTTFEKVSGKDFFSGMLIREIK